MSAPKRTTWAATTQTSGTPSASFQVRKDGGAAEPFVVKGICYSPCRIGGSNAFGRGIGDWFRDSTPDVIGCMRRCVGA